MVGICVNVGSIVKVIHCEGEEGGKIKIIIRQWILHFRNGWKVVVDGDLAVQFNDARGKVLELD